VPSSSLRSLAPPPWATSFRTDTLDAVRAFVARTDGEHSRVAHGTGPLGYEWHAVGGRAVAVRWSRASLAQTIRGSLGMAALHLSIDSASTYAFGRRRFEVAPGEAIFIAPGWEFTRHAGPGAVVAIGVDRDALAAEIDGRAQRTGGACTLRSRAVAWRGNARALVEAALRDVVATSARGAPPRRRDLGEADAVSAIADLLAGPGGHAATHVAAARLAAVEAWIDAHLQEPITIGRLCAIAGVGARSLQAAFASLRGVSPLRFVAERRLAAARGRLLRSGEARDVTSVALEVGFAHLGRFATLYRQAYGESPSQTLRGRPG